MTLGWEGLRAEALNNLGVVLGRSGDLDGAEGALRGALEVYEGLDCLGGVASARLNLGVVSGERGEFVEAGELLDRSLEVLGESGDQYGYAACLNDLGVISWGSEEGAGERFEEALGFARGLGLPGGLMVEMMGSVLDNLARVRLGSNRGVDDLLELASELSLEVEALEGWGFLREGHELAARGLWGEAHELVVRGRRALGGSGPSRFVWLSVGVV
jgi:tetratricopeptide (TPR) repeat protein